MHDDILALVAAVNRLSPPLRTVILLRWFEGLPPRKIAELLQVLSKGDTLACKGAIYALGQRGSAAAAAAPALPSPARALPSPPTIAWS